MPHNRRDHVMAGGRPTRVTAAARAALQAAGIDGHTVTITDTLPGAAWTQVKKLLELAGGAYDMGKSSCTFPGPAAAVVEGMLAAGQVVADRHTAGYVPTPAALAARLVSAEFGNAAELPDGALVLEPSAGDGQIVRALIAANPGVRVTALEPDEIRFGQLFDSTRLAGLSRVTFEDYVAKSSGDWFDLIVMNPPFHIAGLRDVWAEHVILAFELLKPGGRVVAVVPAESYVRSEQHHQPGRTWAKNRHDGILRQIVADSGRFTALPAADFPGIGIGVGVLVIDRPIHDNRASYLYRNRDEHTTPVLVAEPRTSWVAALNTPVQTWYSPWAGAERVFRNVGRCFTCKEPVWAFDDGENDPRGVLGAATARPLHAEDLDVRGPTMLQCSRHDCSTGAAEEAAAAAGKAKHWKHSTVDAKTMHAAVDSALLPSLCAYTLKIYGVDRSSEWGPRDGNSAE